MHDDSFPSTAIIVLTRNAENHIERCLDGVLSQNYPNVEIDVIDSGSIDRTLELLQKYPCRIWKIRPEDFHDSKTRNLGVRLAHTKYIVFLVADAYPSGSLWLRKLVEPLKNPKVGIVFGRQLPKPAASPIETYFLSISYPNKDRVFDAGSVRASPSQLVLNSDVAAAYRRDLLLEFPFDETLPWNEDQEIARRLLRAGYLVVYRGDASVYHSHTYSLRTLFMRYFDVGQTLVRIGVNRLDALDSLRYLLDLLRGTIRHISSQRIPKKTSWSFYSVLYNLVKVCAFYVGTKRAYLPDSLAHMLSMVYKRTKP